MIALQARPGSEQAAKGRAAAHEEGLLDLIAFHDLIGRGEDILWWQMCIRAILIFLFGVVLLRLFGRRAFAKLTALDIVLAILVGSNLSRALTASAPFGPTLAATAALMICFWIFDHLAARWPRFGRLTKGEPVWLAQGGRLDRQAMKRAGVSEGDLEEAARRSGTSDLGDVREAVLERSGKISTIERE